MRLSNILSSIFLLLPFLVNAQPSSHTGFEFRLFDKNGKIVDPNNFCTEYKLIDPNRSDNYNLCDVQSSLHYDQRFSTIRLSTSTVYRDVEFYFVHKTDTLAVLVINSGYGAIISIDSLVFKPGYYAIKCSSRIVNGKTLPKLPVLKLKEIDFESAKADYYNSCLDQYIKGKSTNLNAIKKFRKIQRIYHISKEDLDYKAAQQIIFKK